jgi:glycosyltransferase involved in cell wall biosynthesis
MMKVCIVSPKVYGLFSGQYYTRGMFGGSEVQLFFLAKELSRQNYQTCFITANYGQPAVKTIDKIKLYRSFSYFENPFFGFIKLVRCLYITKSDIYIQQALSPMSGIIALYCLLFRKKFVYWVASDIETDGSLLEKLSFPAAFLSRLALNLSHHIIAQNSFQFNNLRKKFEAKLHLIKNGLPIPEGTPEKNNTILWVGRCEKLKKPEVFIRLATYFPQNNFVMICPPALNQEEYFDKIKKEASKVNNLYFLDFVRYQDISQYFEKSIVFVNTSDYEGFPNTFIQAAYNRNAILSLEVDPDQFIEKYECGICCKNSAKKPESALAEILSEKEKLAYYAENSFAYCLQNHDYQKNTQEFIKKIMN